MTILLAAALTAALTPTGYVTDAAGMLDAAGKASLETTVRAYEQRTGTEIAVVTVPSLGGEAIETYANNLFHAWGVGKRGKDNGVMLLWAPTERKVRIEVGYGLEQALPDGRAGQIIREAITPRFRAGQWQAGLQDGVSAIMAQLDSQATPRPPPADSPFPWAAALLICIVVVVPVSIGLYLATRVKRRPAQATSPVYHHRQSFPSAVAVERPRKRSGSYASSSSSSSNDSSSSSSWSSSSDSGGSFGGGDSGGGGASGSY